MRLFDCHLWEFTIAKRRYGLPMDEDRGTEPSVGAQLEHALRRTQLPLRQLGLRLENLGQHRQPGGDLRPRQNLRLWVNSVAPDRRTFRTVSRAILSSRAMRLIPLPF
jgi:hypothetical protein